MIFKFITILAIAAACNAIPLKEVLKPENEPINVNPLPENTPIKPENAVQADEKAPLPAGADDKTTGSKSDETDLKTDNTFWWGSSYRYPARSRYYYNYQYLPRTFEYTYYTAPRTYSYWTPYW